MTIQTKILCAVAVSGFAAFAVMSPAQALTTQECSAKYQAAKTTATEAKAPETATEKKARTAISFECSKQADEKKLKGKERKKFRSECKKTAADKAK